MNRENNLEPRRRPGPLVWAIDGLLFLLGSAGVLRAAANASTTAEATVTVINRRIHSV